MAEPEPTQWSINYDHGLTSGERLSIGLTDPRICCSLLGVLSTGISLTLSNATIGLATQSPLKSGEDGEEAHYERGIPSSIWGNTLVATENVSTDDRPANSPKRDSGESWSTWCTPPPAPADDRTNGHLVYKCN
ncbi:hypothetical protein IFM47457_10566 [Aspergillus lentulus]|nr:hypothetical protein IFM47457_10566 [Aspergillus lentulus]